MTSWAETEFSPAQVVIIKMNNLKIFEKSLLDLTNWMID